MSEAELIARARQGDGGAFGELVERYQSSVYRTALAALRSPQEAEDVAQEAFVAAYEKLAAFRGDATFKTWLLAITWRRALDRRKSVSERLRRFVESDGRLFPEHPAPGRSQEESLIEQDRRDRVRRLIRALPARFRDVLLLMATGDYSFEEAARILGVPVGTAKWRATEGRRLLRRKLIGMGYGDEQAQRRE
ncbi:MAG: RNA polymerase sigma factor [Vicinamibacterales bacterium]